MIYSNILIIDVQLFPLRYWILLDAENVYLTCRQLHQEAFAFFLSHNEFELECSKAEYQWLRRLGAKGRNDLRKIILFEGWEDYATRIKEIWNETRIFNTLAQCQRLHLTIRMRPERWQWLLDSDSLRNIHGFSSVSAALVPRLEQRCWTHDHTRNPDALHWRFDRILRDKHVQTLDHMLVPFGSTYPNNYRIHRAVARVQSQASVNIDFDSGCFYCFLN